MMLLRGKGHACWLAALAGGLAGWLPGWLACLPFIADCMLIVAESQNVRNVFDLFLISTKYLLGFNISKF